MGDRTRGTVKVKVEIVDPDDKLFPELAATVHFLPSESVSTPDAGRSYLFIPKAALFQDNGLDCVWVIAEGDVLRKRRVEVAKTNDDLARRDGAEIRRGRRPQSGQGAARQRGRPVAQ